MIVAAGARRAGFGWAVTQRGAMFAEEVAMMTRRIMTVLLAALALAGAAAPQAAPAQTPAVAPATQAQRADALLTAFTADKPGLAVLVTKGGQPLY